MPQHRINSPIPLLLKARRQLPHLLLPRRHRPPHLRQRGLPLRKRSHKPILPHLHQTQPREVPGPVALRVSRDSRVRGFDDGAAEGEVGRQAPEFGEELVRRYVVDPCAGHGLLEGAGVGFGRAACGGAFDAAELGEGIHAVRCEAGDELLDGGLGD